MTDSCKSISGLTQSHLYNLINIVDYCDTDMESKWQLIPLTLVGEIVVFPNRGKQPIWNQMMLPRSHVATLIIQAYVSLA